MSIRPATLADVSAIASVHVESSHTTYRGILPDEVLKGFSPERRREHWAKTLGDSTSYEFVFVAEADRDHVVGFASGGPEREGDAFYRGELYAIYLLASAQRHGFGRHLVSAVAETLLQQNMKSMLVWVLEENPSRGFYEKLGGKRVRRKTLNRDGKLLQEIAYGWEDVHSLL